MAYVSDRPSDTTIINNRIGDTDVAAAMVAAGAKPSEIRLSRIDQTGKYLVVETALTEIPRAKLASLVKVPRFDHLASTYSVDGTLWFFFTCS